MLTFALFSNLLFLVHCQSNDSKKFILDDYGNNYKLEDFERVFGKSITLFPLRYRNFVDPQYQRFVLTKEKLNRFSATLVFAGKSLDYCDVYIKEKKIIGFKGSISTSQNESKTTLNEIEDKLINSLDAKSIEIKAEEKNKSSLYINKYHYKEWENERMTIAIYRTDQEIKNKNATIWVIALNENEIEAIPKQILETEFDYLTLFRKNKLKYNDKIENINGQDKKIYEKMNKKFQEIPIGDGK